MQICSIGMMGSCIIAAIILAGGGCCFLWYKNNKLKKACKEGKSREVRKAELEAIFALHKKKKGSDSTLDISSVKPQEVKHEGVCKPLLTEVVVEAAQATHSDKWDGVAACTQVNQETINTSSLKPLADKVISENLKLLLLDRIDEIDEESDLIKQALCAVSLIDEIQQMREAYINTDAEVLDLLVDALLEQLVCHDCEVLDSDEWDPAIQKIGKVEYTLPEGASPIITQKLASGLKVKGCIISKQVVALEKSVIMN